MDDRTFAQRVFVMQIIAFALIMGVVTFLGVVCFLVYGQQGGKGTSGGEGLPMISIVSVVMFVSCVGVSLVLPGVILRQAHAQLAANIPRGDANAEERKVAALLSLRQTGLIVGLALLEGAAFMGCIAFLVEAQVFTLAIVAIAIFLMLLRFPLESSLRARVHEDLERINSLRS